MHDVNKIGSSHKMIVVLLPPPAPSISNGKDSIQEPGDNYSILFSLSETKQKFSNYFTF